MNRVKKTLVLGVALLSLTIVAGCGMKGPPLAPLKEGNIIAAPQNLSYTLDGEMVSLAWTHDVDPVNAKVRAEAFKVFVAVKGPEACEGCPFIFKEAGTVPMPNKRFRYAMKQGYRHYFRVQAIGENEKVSPFSKTLFIRHESE